VGAFINDEIVNITLEIMTIITSSLALYYERLEHRRKVEDVIDGDRKAGFFLSQRF